MFSFIGGFIAGAFGLGGGTVFNPLFLSFGVPPKVGTATGMYMVVFSTASSTLLFQLNGMLDLDYGIWIGAWCTLSTLFGMFLMDKLMNKLKR